MWQVKLNRWQRSALRTEPGVQKQIPTTELKWTRQKKIVWDTADLQKITPIGIIQVLKMTEFLAVPLAVLHTSACISAKRICAVRFVFPLAGIHNLLCISSSGNGNQNNYKISARGDAIFWLYFRKRNCRRWIVFPRGGIVNFHASPLAGTVHRNNFKNLRLRECNQNFTSP